MAGRVTYHGGLVTDGLILHLDAARKPSYPGSGNVWYDLTSNQYTGSLVNGTTFEKNRNSGTFSFDGSNDFVDFGIIEQAPSGPANRTIQAWIKDESILDYSLLASFSGYGYDRGGAGKLFMFAVGGTDFNNRKLLIWTNSLNYISTHVLDRNLWTNVAVTVTQGTNYPRITVYKNGVADSGGEKNIDTINTLSYTIGHSNQTYSPFRGQISHNTLYNRALSAEEVLQNYNALKGRFGL